jgi:diguanylate cyclase (GGDEF)-like protein/PAS domain S-box-containing protein
VNGTIFFLAAAAMCGFFVNRMHEYRRALIRSERNRTKEAENSLSLAVEGARLGAWRYCPKERFISFDERFAEHFGLPIGVHAVNNDKILYLIHPDDREGVERARENCMNDGVDFLVEHRVILPNGSEHWIYRHGRPIFSADGSIDRIDGITIDITDRKVAELKYRSSQATLRGAFASANEGILIGDCFGNVVESNDAAWQFFRFEKYEQMPKDHLAFGKVLGIFTLEGEPLTDERHPYKLAIRGFKGTFRLKFQRKDTGVTWFGLVGASPIFNEANEISGASITILDITDWIELQRNLEQKVEQRTSELVSVNRKLEEISRHDVLTGLHNRLASDERLRSEFERMKRTAQRYSILMLDIDFFKDVNDSCGHAVGDTVLKLVAQTLSNNLRDYDFIARWGGEEFLILLPAADFDLACVVAEKLLSAVASKSHPLAGTVTVSIGVATASPEDLDAERAVMKADECLYEAKRRGRNRVVGAISSATSV